MSAEAASPPPLSPDAPQPPPELDDLNGHLNDLDIADEASEQPAALASTSSRTVAIIKHHALVHRFEIERKIQEAGFEIVKERQMEFDVETDPDTLYELFGDDAESFAEGPVWVYVMERRRAVEVWTTMMGDPDPAVAKREAPNSIRALFGKSPAQNAIMGSPDRETAEIQIASLFASSPPFPTSELPEDQFNTMRSLTSPTSSGGIRGVNRHFKARPLPVTHLAPDIAPRTTKAAALRAGIVQSSSIGSMGRLPSSKARDALSKERLEKTFTNVPGHKRAESIAVASTAAPKVAPRQTKAALLRAGVKPAPTLKRNPSSASSATSGNARQPQFDGIPGHKRRETIQVASVSAPTVAPRLNKAASLRAEKDKAPPSAFFYKPGGTGTLSRSNSQSSLSPPKRAPSQTSRPVSQNAMNSPALSRTTSIVSSAAGENGKTNGSADSDKPKAPRPTSIAAPKMAPRSNKAAELRAQKKAEEEEKARIAAQKAARRKTIGVSRGASGIMA